MMNALWKRAAMLGVAGLLTAGTVAPSLAQTVVVPQDRFYGTYPSERVYPQWNHGMSGTECWTDEGYGRRAQCDGGGGS